MRIPRNVSIVHALEIYFSVNFVTNAGTFIIPELCVPLYAAKRVGVKYFPCTFLSLNPVAHFSFDARIN
jgi:hypothetical protein